MVTSGFDNGRAANSWHAIIGTNDGLFTAVYMRHLACIIWTKCVKFIC